MPARSLGAKEILLELIMTLGLCPFKNEVCPVNKQTRSQQLCCSVNTVLVWNYRIPERHLILLGAPGLLSCSRGCEETAQQLDLAVLPEDLGFGS